MKKIIYILVVAATCYLNLMYEWGQGIYLLSAELYLFAFCAGSAVYMKRKLNASIEMDKILIGQRDACKVRIKIENNGMAGTAVNVILACRYVSDGREQKLVSRAYVDRHETKEVVCSFSPEYCGKMEIRVKKFQCYGFLELFSKSKKCNEKVTVTVMPKPYPVAIVVSNKTKWFPIDGESYADNRSGEDSAEIYDVREYQAGDRLQKVHWKLSAREETLYIKEFSYPLGAAVILLLEGGRVPFERGQAPFERYMSPFIEAVVSISTALVEVKCPYYVIWKNREDDKIQRLFVQNEEDLYEWIITVVAFEKNCLETDMEEWYRHEYRNETYSTMIKIDTELHLQINSDERMNMTQTSLQDFFQTVEIVV